ncbi:amino acid ABC transporter permease [Cryobacterium aureum]|uniref:amino acid ABC transporter permease n=1 Tax=Cryobacterium aureum TaxID=995037 RepID=UPI000CF4E436|nr:amino acid ABC transporter permease [Cryobacterium aureum]
MNFIVVLASFPQLLEGLLITLALSAASIVGSTLLGLLAATLRVSRVPIGSQIARIYVEVFRGSPLLITLLFVYFGSAYAGYHMNIFAAAVVGISVYQGAYIAEIIRAGIESVPPGQWEASKILGLSNSQTFVSVVLPQTGKIVLPPLIGQYIALIKDTSIAFVIGLAELVRQGQAIIDRVGQPLAVYVTIAALYFIICYPLSRWVRGLEKRSQPA